jgi:hypothetical protein
MAKRKLSHQRRFHRILTDIRRAEPVAQEIHIVLDNLPSHKTQAVKEFLDQNPRVRFHFTRTYSSWPNQVEIWFAKNERYVIARGVFTSVADPSCKLMKCIRVDAKSMFWFSVKMRGKSSRRGKIPPFGRGFSRHEDLPI